MNIDIVIPLEKWSLQLDRTLKSIEDTIGRVKIITNVEPDINVAEARQTAMDRSTAPYMLFLDFDSEMFQPDWLNKMFEKLDQHSDAGIVFAKEWWGTGPCEPLYGSQTETDEAYFGSAACMLIDRTRIPKSVRWDKWIGLRNGWIGGDFEERDFCAKVYRHGLKMYQADCMFHHTDKTTIIDWVSTDRGISAKVMKNLISYKYDQEPDNDDWFKKLRYLKADPTNDNILALGQSIRDCYLPLILEHGLQNEPIFKRLGIT